MTPITRKQQREIWQHFLTNVIQARTTATDTQSELEKAMAFEGFDAWDDIYSVVDATFIWNLQTETTVGDAAPVMTPVPNRDIHMLINAIEYVKYEQDATAHMAFTSLNDWLAITKEDVVRYRTSPGTRTRRNPNAPSAPIHPLNNPVTDWDKGVKRDMTLFPAIKTDTQFDNWNRETLAVAAAQNVSDVFDPNYVPPVAGNNLLLWERQQKFVYAMFNKTLLSDNGKKLVRQHENDKDAHAVYRKFCDIALRSTKTSIQSSDVLTYITSSRIDDGKWQGTMESYIINWQDTVRRYHNMIDSSSRFADSQLIIMLQNAVKPNASLAHVKTTADSIKTTTGQALDYSSYCELLTSAATVIDSDTPARIRPKRRVYMADSTNDSSFDIDTTSKMCNCRPQFLEDQKLGVCRDPLFSLIK